jgi:trehalose 6-phosphate synthase/phosphatase
MLRMEKITSPPSTGGRLMVVSNRAPFRIIHEGGTQRVEPTVGGVATTFLHLLEMHGGLWLAWSGGSETPAPLRIPANQPRFSTVFLGLSERQVAHYYWGMCNRALWPLMHMMPQYCHFSAQDWVEYGAVNRIFAQRCLVHLQAGDSIWIQDFHLALMPALLRTAGANVPIAMFWHIPFPAPDILKQFPWHRELLEGMLGADLIGFHTPVYASAFLECCQNLLGAGVECRDGSVFRSGHRTRVGAYPIGVPVAYFQNLSRDAKVKRRLAQIRRGVRGEKIVLGVDRLDYTKGLVRRLQAYERFLEENPAYHERVSLVQIAVPSRTRVPEYRMLAHQVEETVARIVARFATQRWLPVRYLYKQYNPEVLVAYYLAADVALVTPLADGMNLVAKEYVATHADGRGVLILSEKAGAALELKDALLVDPYDLEQVAHELKHALEIEPEEQARRMAAMRAAVQKNTLTQWSQAFLQALQATQSELSHHSSAPQR